MCWYWQLSDTAFNLIFLNPNTVPVFGLRTGRSLTENTIPDAVLMQFDFLMMSTELLETCRGLRQ